MRRTSSSGIPLAALLAVAAGPFAASAQEAPRSFMASPEVYKVVGENEQYRVIEATWKPGQRDALHSHGAATATYFLTDCHMLAHSPDGKTREIDRKAGNATVRPPPSETTHWLENLGKETCKMVIFEPK